MLVVGVGLTADIEKNADFFLGVAVDSAQKTKVAGKVHYIHKTPQTHRTEQIYQRYEDTAKKMNEKENENIFGKTERNRPLSTYP